ncbi:MAG: hypothetical protein HRU15_16945 [Planctomycetes bacterium]|nr:hypothetical protein [Planctomycetota bacterium]
MSQTIRIELVHKQESDLRSWASICIEKNSEESGEKSGPQFTANIDSATAFRGDLSAAVMQVLSSEIQAGMLMGLKQAKDRNWQISLVELGASKAGGDAILQVPSDGFAVAATLAVAHGSGAEDLEANPHGGYLWSFDSMRIDD